MYAVIRRYEGVSKETADEAARRAHAEFRRHLSQRPGFVAYELIIGDDTMTSLSVFETWVVAEETSLWSRNWIRDNLSDLNLPSPQVTAGEIYTSSDRPPPFAPAPRRKFRMPFENPDEAQRA